MRDLEKIKQTIEVHKSLLAEKYCVTSLSIFGSYLRPDMQEKGDLDILVDFSKTIDLFTFIELEDFLSRILGKKVDLVMKDTLKPRIKDRILKEAVEV